MQDFLRTYGVEVLGAFSFICFYIAVSSILNAIRDGTEKIVNAITSLELSREPNDNSDYQVMYLPPRD
jgi:hypothetical protein